MTATALSLATLLSSAAALADDAVDFGKQLIRIALPQEPPLLNGMKATDQVSILVLSHVTEGLVRYDRRGRIVPGVAESWDMRPAGATFNLRSAAYWRAGLGGRPVAGVAGGRGGRARRPRPRGSGAFGVPPGVAAAPGATCWTRPPHPSTPSFCIR